MFFTIYKITNLINCKIYIGLHRTKDLNDGYMGSGKRIKLAIEKYGIKNFKKEILFIFDNPEDMIAKEKELVTEEFCLREDTYNLAKGGGDGFSYVNRNGLNISDKQKEAARYHRGVICNQRRNELLKDPQYRSVHSSRLSKAMKELYKTHPGGFAGKMHSEETKKRIGLTNSKHQSGENNSQFGTMWITNGIDSKRINKTEEIPKDWKVGRIMKNK